MSSGCLPRAGLFLEVVHGDSGVQKFQWFPGSKVEWFTVQRLRRLSGCEVQRFNGCEVHGSTVGRFQFTVGKLRLGGSWESGGFQPLNH